MSSFDISISIDIDSTYQLQNDINILEEWANQWMLKFHPDKCHVLTLGKFENTMYTKRYQISGQEMEHVFDEKDLGVIFDSNMSFDQHIARKVNKANSMMGLIRRSFSYLDCKTFIKLYCAFVRPHLEYAQSVWAPHLKRNIDIIEGVQIRATKQVDGLSNMTYEECLRKLNLPTMAYRRLRGDLIEVYKHLNSYDTELLPASFQRRLRPSRKHQRQLYDRIPKDGACGVQSNSFYYRVPKVWNELPNYVVQSQTLNSFKNQLDHHFSSIMFNDSSIH